MAEATAPARGAPRSSEESRPARDGSGGSRGRSAAEERGSLVVADRVLEALARTAVLEVDGARGDDGRLGGVLGGSLPSVDVDHAGGRARVAVRVGAAWPAPAPELAQRVRERVAGRLHDLGGVQVDAVDVEVHALAPDAEHDTGRETGAALAGAGGLRAAPAPTAAVGVTVAACVLALVVVALGALLGHEGLVALGVLGGSSWLAGPVQALDGLAPSSAVTAIGVGVAVVGLLLVVLGLSRRRRRWVGVESRSGVVLHRRDVARVAAGAARSVDGVLDAGASTGRRSVEVSARATGPLDDAAVRAAVADRLGVLRPAPRVRVRTETAGSAS
ncbi:Asp23/Gls24 family envelope stress response protein [uncultured Pseudokineococcus sp.]|uniref:Asp23/Gls24 family envelope stress response protein n=1 Tax=uncultured Pseudokineococcus sp. TaxID=1642928 RepID=UPI0026281559|nr:DUF6286 domain-containing protein [uncultured Pseudokineococcus sp.]